MQPLTPAQRAVLTAVNAFHQSRRYAPTVREVNQAVGTRSLGTMSWHIGRLTESGFLASDRGKQRSLRLGPRVAGSRNGVLAEVVTVFSRCRPCGMDVPSTHVCSPTSLDEGVRDVH